MTLLVAAIRVKNEEWILDFTLSCLSDFCDAIVCVDDGSSDESVAIMKSYKKVRSIHINHPKNYRDIDEPRDWNKLTELAIACDAEWILYLDADEMVSPNICERINEYTSQDDYDVVRFRKITPWFSFSKYRSDMPRFNHPPENVLNPILVRQVPSLKWDNNRGSFFKKLLKFAIRGEKFKPNYGRVFPNGVKDNALLSDDVVSLHYNFLDFNKILRKQLFYAIREREVRPDKTREEIIEFAAKALLRGNEELESIDKSYSWQKYLDKIRVSL